ncbi:polyprenol monophosphomannose synthase [Alienimonas chondri]|uniref:Polyprenol monophosphomannose synthase n=1 Tax=Alienimonas chondri TaxID=2681879 RepID=A0ABX1V7F4_9PLAN|nr:polyprenol monophosphomannose synthase [Alienimonas chondri]NNJ24159.1 Polyprenol monophosphomannose synthase [Alienimonas chondri]
MSDVPAEGAAPVLAARADRIQVVLCTYNERENVPDLAAAILAVDDRLDVLVVDDDSPDGTAAAVEERFTENPRVSVSVRQHERGLGSATLAGLRAALADGYGAVVTMDADWSHHPRHLPALLAVLETHEMAIGSRYVPGGAIEGWPLKRLVMSRAINIYSRALLGLTQRDCSGAYRAFRRELLNRVDFEAIRSTGYSFMEEFLYRCVAAGATVAETPVTFTDRAIGHSKINGREAIAALWTLGGVGRDRLFRRG